MAVTTADQSLIWTKSTHSAADGDCVEVACIPIGVAVRDSKDPRGPVLQFNTEAWRSFIDGVRRDDFSPPFTQDLTD